MVDAEREADAADHRQMHGAAAFGRRVVAKLAGAVVAPARHRVETEGAGVNGAGRHGNGIGRPIGARGQSEYRRSRSRAIRVRRVAKLAKGVRTPALDSAVITDDARVIATRRDAALLRPVTFAGARGLDRGGEQKKYECRENGGGDRDALRHGVSSLGKEVPSAEGIRALRLGATAD